MAKVRKQRPTGFAEPKTPYGNPRPGGPGEPGAAPDMRKLPGPEALPDGTTRYFLVLGPKGRVLLPADMRKAMELAEGDVLTAWLKDGEVRLHSHRHGLRKIQDASSSITKAGHYVSDELIAERRAEAAKDDRETLRWLRARKGKRR